MNEADHIINALLVERNKLFAVCKDYRAQLDHSEKQIEALKREVHTLKFMLNHSNEGPN